MAVGSSIKGTAARRPANRTSVEDDMNEALYWVGWRALLYPGDRTVFLKFGVLDQILYYWMALTAVSTVLIADRLIKNSRVERAWEALLSVVLPARSTPAGNVSSTPSPFYCCSRFCSSRL